MSHRVEGDKRNYVRRRRTVAECQADILKALTNIAAQQNTPTNLQILSEKASILAQSVEASCWSPRHKLSDSEFRFGMTQKTRQLIEALYQQERFAHPKFIPFPQINQVAAQKPKFSLPILSRSNSVSVPTKFPLPKINSPDIVVPKDYLQF